MRAACVSASTTYGYSLYYIWFTASTTYLANAYRLRISVWTTVDARLSRSAARPTTRLLWPHAQMRPELTRDGLGLTELEFVLAMLIELGIVEWGKVPQQGQSPHLAAPGSSAPAPPQGACARRLRASRHHSQWEAQSVGSLWVPMGCQRAAAPQLPRVLERAADLAADLTATSPGVNRACGRAGAAIPRKVPLARRRRHRSPRAGRSRHGDEPPWRAQGGE